MEEYDLFKDVVERTGGDIYLGVVGPVRTGKSTFIKRFMDLLILPKIKNPNVRERVNDELPQSGAGRTITTTEPKFVPDTAVEVEIKEGLKIKVRLVDCVGYTVEGAIGYEEEEGPRMVKTPWADDAMPFQDAAETGTQKVIDDHSTIGIIITTDGSITDIPRENYIEAEERVIWELKEMGKPFIVVLNSTHPHRQDTIELANSMEEEYDIPVIPVDCQLMEEGDILNILEEALYEFPVTEVNIGFPKWVEELEDEHWLRKQFEEEVRQAIEEVKRLRDIDSAVDLLAQCEHVGRVALKDVDLGTGATSIGIAAKEGLFYKILDEETGFTIDGEHTLLKLMRELAVAKREYDKIAFGLQEVRATGYGVVIPTVEEIVLEEPEIIKQGGRSGVKLKATAPSYHLIKADISTEITPLIGTEKQCEELIQWILEEFEDSPEKIWQTNIFGKSLHDLVKEGIQSKLYRMPENAQLKLQETLGRIVNDGGGGLICIII
ncbi:MAG: stage IV sporulation protein A [Clostridia bacterium]|nr:stage IV sporulation protein A [Clostridia bacterium]